MAYFLFLLDHFFTDKIMSLDSLLDYLEDRNLLIGAFPFIDNSKKEQKILKDIEKNFTDRIIVNLLNSPKKSSCFQYERRVGNHTFQKKLQASYQISQTKSALST